MSENERLKELLKKQRKRIAELEEEIKGYKEIANLSAGFVLAAAAGRGEVCLSRRVIEKAAMGAVSIEENEDGYIIRGGARLDSDTDAQRDNKRGSDNGACELCEKGK